MTKKRSTKVPSNLQQLAKEGQRVRFNGFWLSDSLRDRMVADWLDTTPQAGAIIKAMIYSMITGSGFISVREPGPSEQVIDDYPEEIGAAGSALLDLDD